MRRAITFAGLSSAALLVSSHAWAGEFDARGAFSFDEGAVVTFDFATFSEAPDAGDGSAAAEDDASALTGGRVLSVSLKTEGYPIPVELPTTQGSYRLRFWLRGDCTGGFAADYADGSEGTVSQAFPTGRVTSDGWLEMQTEPFVVDGGKAGVDARMFLSAYDANTPTTVEIDAVEIVPEGSYVAPSTCSGLDAAGDCAATEMCVGGLCRDARGWYPPLPSGDERAQLAAYWQTKIRHSFGPIELRRSTMAGALATLDKMAGATNNVEYWSRFTEAIRRLRDAHTYARATAWSSVNNRRPLDACFFEGDGDVSQVAAPSESGQPDILVSHVGTGDSWGLKQGDRLVSIDGEHPLAWARKLMAPSPWYWEADDPDQIANILSSLRSLIGRHASTISVVHCDAAAGTCSDTPEVITLSELPVVTDSPSLVGCDNRPFFPVDGAPEDHDFGDALFTPAKVIHGPVIDSTPQENIYGLIWNTLFGDGDSMPVDRALKSAVDAFGLSRGVLMDHREGHGGTSQTANILISFARTPYTPLVSYVRNRANDDGPADAAAGVAIFERYTTQYDIFGSTGAHTEIPVAFLMTWDVSASDFLPFILKGGSNVRLFGPGPSMGAYGTFMQYSLWGVMRWSVGIEDSIGPDGTLLCTRGVDPDELVLPRQSDLLAGRDTVADAAMAWLRTRLAP